MGSGLYLCSFLIQWAEDTEGGLQNWQQEARLGTGRFSDTLSLQLEGSHSLLLYIASESATLSDHLAPKQHSKQAMEKATTKKSQENPLQQAYLFTATSQEAICYVLFLGIVFFA